MPIYFRTPPTNEPFSFETIGNHWKQKPVIRPKGHPRYHYIQSEKGRGRIKILDKEYVLEENEGVLIAPCITHTYAKDSAEWYTMFATFTGTMESDLSKMLGNRQSIFIKKEQGKQIKQLISNIVAAFEKTPLDTHILSIDCYRLLMNFVDAVNMPHLLNEPLYVKYVDPVIKIIETQYDCRLTAQELSQKVYITPQYLSRLFTRFLGYSVYEYLTMYRISKAKELLLTQSHLDIREISLRVGFQDTSHFIVMFKKITGTTPLEFRKNN